MNELMEQLARYHPALPDIAVVLILLLTSYLAYFFASRLALAVLRSHGKRLVSAWNVALHTVKAQNRDKTITTISTHRLINDSFKNWRGMSASGGRRIKRALYLDASSVRFLTAEEVDC